MKIVRLLQNFGLVSALAVTSLSAHAAACSGAAFLGSEQPDTTDVTYSGNTPTVNSDSCAAKESTNDSEAALGALLGGTWVWLDKSGDDKNGTISGIGFELAYTGPVNGLYSYTITPSVGSPPLPKLFDFAFVVKQGNDFVAYVFNDALVNAGANGGTFVVGFGPGTNAFSHVSLYGTGVADTCPPTDPRCQITEVPEPATLALLGMGLLGVALARRRRT